MKKLLVALSLMSFIVTGCSVNGGDVIMKVNGEPVKKSQFDKKFKELSGGSPFAANLKSAKDSDDKEQNMLYVIFRDKAVNELIYDTLIQQEIKRRNIIVTNEDYEKEFETIISIVGSKSALADKLKAAGISSAQFKKATMQHLTIAKLADSISKQEVTEEDISKYYKNRKAAFSYPEQVRASHILVLADEDEYSEELKKKNPQMTEADLKARVNEEMLRRKEKAEQILKEVKANPNNFAKIAKAKSDDRTSAINGGELGFFTRKEMVKEFSDAAFSLPANKVSDLVKSKYGYHIIIVTDRREAGSYPYAMVKNEIAQVIKANRQMNIINDLATALKKNANIEFVNKDYEGSGFQKLIDEGVVE